jgi:hypothetical protein
MGLALSSPEPRGETGDWRPGLDEEGEAARRPLSRSVRPGVGASLVGHTEPTVGRQQSHRLELSAGIAGGESTGRTDEGGRRPWGPNGQLRPNVGIWTLLFSFRAMGSECKRPSESVSTVRSSQNAWNMPWLITSTMVCGEVRPSESVGGFCVTDACRGSSQLTIDGSSRRQDASHTCGRSRARCRRLHVTIPSEGP